MLLVSVWSFAFISYERVGAETYKIRSVFGRGKYHKDLWFGGRHFGSWFLYFVGFLL